MRVALMLFAVVETNGTKNTRFFVLIILHIFARGFKIESAYINSERYLLNSLNRILAKFERRKIEQNSVHADVYIVIRLLFFGNYISQGVGIVLCVTSSSRQCEKPD